VDPLPPWPDDGRGAYTERLADALALAAWGHREHRRKRGVEEPLGDGPPYLGHLLEVAALAMAAGADEDQAVAALLHDAVEDWADNGAVGSPEEATALIADRYGDRVVSLVMACTDSDPEGSGRRDAATWLARKEHHLERLRSLPADHLLVPAADKVANARALLDDLADEGLAVWSRFNAGPQDQLWYFRSNLAVLSDRLPDHLLTLRLRTLVDRLAETVPSG
jgi:(p)ppGpp synthase/HD superfamily hydrolase